MDGGGYDCRFPGHTPTVATIGPATADCGTALRHHAAGSHSPSPGGVGRFARRALRVRSASDMKLQRRFRRLRRTPASIRLVRETAHCRLDLAYTSAVRLRGLGDSARSLIDARRLSASCRLSLPPQAHRAYGEGVPACASCLVCQTLGTRRALRRTIPQRRGSRRAVKTIRQTT